MDSVCPDPDFYDSPSSEAASPDVMSEPSVQPNETAEELVEVRPLNPDEPQNYFQSLDDFVRSFIAYIYERPCTAATRTWCPEWWRHPEAVYRLDQLWKSWEHMRVEQPATGPVTWLVSYADPIMSVLFDPAGPFKGCSPEHGHQTRRPFENGLPCVKRPDISRHRN